MELNYTKKAFSILCTALMIAMIFQNVSADYNSGDDMDIFIDSYGDEHMVWRGLVNGTYQVFYAYEEVDEIFNKHFVNYTNEIINHKIKFDDGYLTLKNCTITSEIKIKKGNVLIEDCNITGKVKIDKGRLIIRSSYIDGDVEAKNADFELRNSYIDGKVKTKKSKFSTISVVITGNTIERDVDLHSGICYVIGNIINHDLKIHKPASIHEVSDNEVGHHRHLHTDTGGFDGLQITNTTTDVMYPQVAVDPVTGFGYVLWLENNENFYYIGTDDFVNWGNPIYIGSEIMPPIHPGLDISLYNGILTITWNPDESLSFQSDMDGDLIPDIDDEFPMGYNLEIGDSSFIPDAVSVDMELGISVAIDYSENATVQPIISLADIPSFNGSVETLVNVTTTSNQSFSAIIKFKYDSSTLPENITEKYLRMYWLDVDEWTILKNSSAGENTEVDMDAHIVWGRTNHFSTYAISDSLFIDSDGEGLTDAEEINADGNEDAEITTFSDGSLNYDITFQPGGSEMQYIDIPLFEPGIERLNSATMDIDSSIEYAFEEMMQIQPTTSASMRGPCLYEDKLVYQDDRNGNNDIFMYDLSTGTETQITNDPLPESTPKIWGNNILFYRTSVGSIVVDYTTAIETFIGGYSGDIYENYIVIPGTTLYDLTDNSSISIPNDALGDVGIYGDYVAHTDHTINDIRLYQISTGIQSTVNTPGTITPFLLDINEKYVIYSDRDTTDLFVYNILTQETINLPGSEYIQNDPAISGDFALWTDLRNDSGDIYGYDLVNDVEIPICTEPGKQETPVMYGDTIAWSDLSGGVSWDIYKSAFTMPSFTLSVGTIENVALEFDLALGQSAIPDFSVTLNEYLSQHNDGDDGDEDGFISIPIIMSSNGLGSVSLSNIYMDLYIVETDPVNIDTDTDLLNDYEEQYTWFTSAVLEDTEGDGLLDGEEILIYNCNPNNPNSDKLIGDGDSLTDFDEVYLYGTDPMNPDSDSDILTDSEEIAYRENTVFSSHQVGLTIPPSEVTITTAMINSLGTSVDLESASMIVEINGIEEYEMYLGYYSEGVLTHIETITAGTTDLISLGYSLDELNGIYDWELAIHSYDMEDGELLRFDIVLNSVLTFVSKNVGEIIGMIPGFIQANILNVITATDDILLTNAKIEIEITGIADFRLYLGGINVEFGTPEIFGEIFPGITDITIYGFGYCEEYFVEIYSQEDTPGTLSICEITVDVWTSIHSPDEGILLDWENLSDPPIIATIPNVVVSSNILMTTISIISYGPIPEFSLLIGYDGLPLANFLSIGTGTTNLIDLGFSANLFSLGYDWQLYIYPLEISDDMYKEHLDDFKFEFGQKYEFKCEELGTEIPIRYPAENIAIIEGVNIPGDVTSATLEVELSDEVGRFDLEIGYWISTTQLVGTKSISLGTTDLLALGYDSALFNQGYKWQLNIINYDDKTTNLNVFEITSNGQEIFTSPDVGMPISSETPIETIAWIRNIDANGYIHNVHSNIVFTGDADYKIYLGYYLAGETRLEKEVTLGNNDLTSLGFSTGLFKAGYDWKLTILSYSVSPVILSTFEIVVEQSPSPLNGDSDADGLDDKYEVDYTSFSQSRTEMLFSGGNGISPLIADTDEDGLDDNYEINTQYISSDYDTLGLLRKSQTSSLSNCYYSNAETNWDALRCELDTISFFEVYNSASIVDGQFYVICDENNNYHDAGGEKDYNFGVTSSIYSIFFAVKPMQLGTLSRNGETPIVNGYILVKHRDQRNNQEVSMKIWSNAVQMVNDAGNLETCFMPVYTGSYNYFRVIVDASANTAELYHNTRGASYFSSSECKYTYVRLSGLTGPDYGHLWIEGQNTARYPKSPVEYYMDNFYICNGRGMLFENFKIADLKNDGIVDDVNVIIDTGAANIVDQHLYCKRLGDGQSFTYYNIPDGTTNILSDFDETCFTTLSYWIIQIWYDSVDVGWRLDNFEIVFTSRTDPEEWDTDKGGTKDGDENIPSEYYPHGSNPSFKYDDPYDTDLDGLNDYFEIEYSGTLPGEFDTDGDGLWDGDELFPNLIDKDGLFAYTDTDPLSPDSDQDYLSDMDEAHFQVGELYYDFETYGISQWNPTSDWNDWQHVMEDNPPETYGKNLWCWGIDGQTPPGMKTLESPPIDISDCENPTLTFWYIKPTSAFTWLYINGVSVETHFPTTTTWSFISIDINDFVDSTITIKFHYQGHISGASWYLDDVKILGYSDPWEDDTDGDSIKDGIEYHSVKSSPLRIDSDGDGWGDVYDSHPGAINHVPEVIIEHLDGIAYYEHHVIVELTIKHNYKWDIKDATSFTEHGSFQSTQIGWYSGDWNTCAYKITYPKAYESGGAYLNPDWITFTIADEFGNAVKVTFDITSGLEISEAKVESFFAGSSDLPIAMGFVSVPFTTAASNPLVLVAVVMVVVASVIVFEVYGSYQDGSFEHETRESTLPGWNECPKNLRFVLDNVEFPGLPSFPLELPSIGWMGKMTEEVWKWIVDCGQGLKGLFDIDWEEEMYQYLVDNPSALEPFFLRPKNIFWSFTEDMWSYVVFEMNILGTDVLIALTLDSPEAIVDQQILTSSIVRFLILPAESSTFGWALVTDITGWSRLDPKTIPNSNKPGDDDAKEEDYYWLYSDRDRDIPGENVLSWDIVDYVNSDPQDIPQPAWAVLANSIGT
ncbi:MAG: hypothetical protein KAS32_18235 [Candidatus Peribacteraceae bacterium]|nr:hypothetical protein [Candidatus Peribacteraceae bacterium]